MNTGCLHATTRVAAAHPETGPRRAITTGTKLAPTGDQSLVTLAAGQSPDRCHHCTPAFMRAWIRLIFASAITFGLGAMPVSAQALTGTTGLVTVPTATMPADGAVTVGVTRLDERYHGYAPRQQQGHDAIVQFASVGFLPFVEVGLRLTRVVDLPRQANGDRMVSVRIRMLREGAYAPAVVVGVHDIVGTRYFHAEYVVASKQLVTPLGAVGLHTGYGGDWSSRRARGRQFVGGFGGISVAPRAWVTLMAEHDAERVNAGVRLRVGRFAVLGAAQGLDRFSGGISYTHRLPD